MDKRKEAWRLHVEANMPVRAIAQALGVPVGTVKAWLHRDRRRGAQPATDTGPATTATDATNATLQPAGGATDGATATRTATGATCDGYILPDTATDAGATGDATGPQDALVPPPPDSWGRPYISLIATFGRHSSCPSCHQPWPSPRWDSTDSMRRLVVLDLGGDGDPRERLLINLFCKACADAGPKGSVRYAQVVPARRGGDCFDCARNPRDLGPDEFVACIDNRTRCLKHAVRFWQYAGQLDYSDRPCVGCGTTESLYVSDDGQVRCKACRLRAWRQGRDGVDAPGRGLPLGL
jgi:hypothetical protein